MRGGRKTKKYTFIFSIITLVLTLLYFVNSKSHGVLPLSQPKYHGISGGYSDSVSTGKTKEGRENDTTRGAVKQCNDAVTWTSRDKPIVGLLGAPGSGLLWLRVIIEQLTGAYSGSVYHDFPVEFKGEGHKQKVLTVMSYNAHELAEMQYGIILYRNAKDCVQTHYITKQYYLHNTNTSIQDFHANFNVDKWTEFAHWNINEWEEIYRLYLEERLPYLVVMYDNLLEPKKIKYEVSRIAKYLNIGVKGQLLDCISNNAYHFKFRPVLLNRKFDPYGLLSESEQKRLQKFDKYIEKRLQDINKKPEPVIQWENEVTV